MKSVRRWATVGVAGLLGLGLGLHPATAQAQARSIEHAFLRAADVASVSSGCTKTLTGVVPGNREVKADGVWRTIRMNRSGTLASSAVRATSVVTGRLAGDARGGTRVSASIATTVDARPKAASPCAVQHYRTESTVAGDNVTLPTRAWLVVRSTVSAKGSFVGEVGALSLDTSADYFENPGTSRTRLLPAGRYIVGVGVQSSVRVPANSTTRRVASSKLSAAVAIHPIGTRREFTGAARAYVKPGHRSCTKHQVVAPLTARARSNAARITFSVDGQRRLVLRGRAIQRSSVTLTRIAPASFGVIRAVVVTKSGATLRMKSTSWPCR